MPTNPTTPNTNASVDRLTLGVDSPRGTEPSFPVPVCMCQCFEAEASGPFACMASICFEAEASYSMACGPCPAQCTNCFETD